MIELPEDLQQQLVEIKVMSKTGLLKKAKELLTTLYSSRLKVECLESQVSKHKIEVSEVTADLVQAEDKVTFWKDRAYAAHLELSALVRYGVTEGGTGE